MKIKEKIDILDAPVKSIRHLTDSIFEIYLDAPEIALKAKPGQFVSIHLGENHQLRRPFSIAGVKEGQVRLVIKKTGRVTKAMSRLSPGDLVSIMGPCGNSFDFGEKKKILCVAGGVGIAPLLFLIEKEVAKRDFYLIFGVKSVDDAWFEDIFTSLKGFLLTTEDGSSYYPGRAVDYLLSTDQFFKAEAMVAVGPLGMLEAYATALRYTEAEGFVSLEAYMGCSLGACNSCLVKTSSGWKKVCQDGPVFRCEEIDFKSLEVPNEF